MVSSSDFLRAPERPTAIATLNRQRHLTPSCGGLTPTAERTVGPARISLESLTPRPGIREQYLPIADICSPAEVFPRPVSAECGFIFLAARNLYAAHLLVCVAAEPENGSRLRKPRGVIPERLFHAGRAVSLSAHRQAPRFGTKADEAFSETAI